MKICGLSPVGLNFCGPGRAARRPTPGLNSFSADEPLYVDPESLIEEEEEVNSAQFQPRAMMHDVDRPFGYEIIFICITRIKNIISKKLYEAILNRIKKSLKLSKNKFVKLQVFS